MSACKPTFLLNPNPYRMVVPFSTAAQPSVLEFPQLKAIDPSENLLNGDGRSESAVEDDRRDESAAESFLNEHPEMRNLDGNDDDRSTTASEEGLSYVSENNAMPSASPRRSARISVMSSASKYV